MTTTRIEQINVALYRIGNPPLIDETDPAAPPHIAVYDSLLKRMAAQPFSFFKTTRRLVRLSSAPIAHFAYAYQLPSERIGPPRAIYADEAQRKPITSYDIQGDQVLCDYENVWANIALLRGPEYWPGDFAECFTLAVMAELALSVREDRALHDRLYQKAFGTPGEGGVGGLFRTALEQDSQATPSTQVGGGVNPLIDVRGSVSDLWLR